MKKYSIIITVLLIMCLSASGLYIHNQQKTIDKMIIDLNNTGALLTEQIKDNQLLYSELDDIITIDYNNPRDLLKFACLNYGLDYHLAITIARLETGNFTSDAYNLCNNVGGMLDENHNPYVYNSLTEGINRFVINLKDNYINIGLDTLEKIQPKYCPTNDGGKHWLKIAKQIYNEEK